MRIWDYLSSFFRSPVIIDPVHPRDPALAEIFSAKRTSAGVHVTETRALAVSAVFTAIRLISETIGALPLHLYKRNTTTHTHDLDLNNPVYWILHQQPNPEVGKTVFWSALMFNAVFHGNGFAEIQRNNAGEPIALWHPPGKIKPIYRDGRRVYELYRLNSVEPTLLRSEDLIHVPGLTMEGVRGLSIFELMKESLGLLIAAEEYSAALFANGSSPNGVLEHPAHFDSEAVATLRESWLARHAGTGNHGQIALLEDGVKFKEVGFSPVDSQMLESRTFGIEDVARWFSIPLHLLKVGGNPSKVTDLSLEFVKFTLQPWLKKIEEEVVLKLIPERQRWRYFARHDLEELTRGDITSRSEAQQRQILTGTRSRDECRAADGLNPIPDGTGSQFLVPVNTMASEMLTNVSNDGKGNGEPTKV